MNNITSDDLQALKVGLIPLIDLVYQGQMIKQNNVTGEEILLLKVILLIVNMIYNLLISR